MSLEINSPPTASPPSWSSRARCAIPLSTLALSDLAQLSFQGALGSCHSQFTPGSSTFLSLVPFSAKEKAGRDERDVRAAAADGKCRSPVLSISAHLTW